MQTENFSNLPKSWQVKTLGEVCEILDNMRKPINATEREQRLKNANRKYAYYGATGQVGYIDDFLCDFESILLGEDGAPFLEPFKNKAYIVSGKYWVNNHAHILKAKENLAINKFVCHFLNIVDYMPYVSGTTRLKLNQSAMKQIKIPLPPLDIQKRIVARLDEAFARIDNGTKHLKSAQNNLTKYKQSLLKSAFNGTLFCHTERSEVSQTLKSTHFTHPLTPSAREGEQDGCHEFKSPLPCGGDLGVGVIANEQSECGNPQNKTIDCHESASLRFADSRNDDKISPSRAESIPHPKPLPQGEGLTFDSHPLADSALSCPPSIAEDNLTISPSLAEGVRGWVDSHNDTTHCHTEALQKAEVSQKSTNRDSSLTAFAQNDNKGNHRDISLSTKAQYNNNGETPNLPQGWTIKTLGEIAQTTSGGTPSRKNLDFWNGNIKWLKSGELNDGYIDEVEETITQSGLENSSAKIFSKGTLLIALYGATIGKLGILNLETSTNQAICAIVPNNELDTKYLFHFLFSIRNKMIKDAFGGAQSNISQTYLKQIKIPLPPLQTQKQIVAILEKHFNSADKTSAFIDSALKNAKQLKSSLLKSAFEGKLVQ